MIYIMVYYNLNKVDKLKKNKIIICIYDYFINNFIYIKN